ncbi:Uma2 family endonuclease [Microcoleus sp. FACHB-61]|nr:Uma2 family endonuclease [Microcoleus sp. FACHB-61]
MTVALVDNPRLKTTQIVVLPNISWPTYQTLLAESGERISSKFAYSRGVLEIMMPSDLHEKINCVLKGIVTALTKKVNLRVKGFSSTSLNSYDLQYGEEQDSCFSLQKFDSILGKNLEILNAASPDLVIKVDFTSLSSNRLPVYQHLGIIERELYRGVTVKIYQLQNTRYIFCEYRLAFLIRPATLLNHHLVQISETQDNNAIVRWPQWVRQQLQTQSL